MSSSHPQQAKPTIQSETFHYVWRPMKGCWRFSMSYIMNFLTRMWSKQTLRLCRLGGRQRSGLPMTIAKSGGQSNILHRMPVYNLVEVPPLTLGLFAGALGCVRALAWGFHALASTPKCQILVCLYRLEQHAGV